MYDLAAYEQKTSSDRTLRAIAERDASHARAAREARAVRHTAQARTSSTDGSRMTVVSRILGGLGGIVRPSARGSADRTGRPQADLPLSV